MDASVADLVSSGSAAAIARPSRTGSEPQSLTSRRSTSACSSARKRTLAKQRPGRSSASSMSPTLGRFVVNRILRPCARTTPSAIARNRCRCKFAVRPGVEYVIRVFDHESVMTPGDELDEDFVALKRTRVGCVKHFGAVTLAPGNCCQSRAHEPRLPGPGWPLKYENRFGRREISLYEPVDRLAQRRVGFVRRRRIGQLFELGA